MKKIAAFLAIAALAIGTSSCEKILDFQANTDSQIPADSAILTISDAQELLVSVYDVAANTYGGWMQNIPEVMADNVADPLGLNGEYAQIWRWTSSFFNGSFGGQYRDAYIAIYRANTLLEEPSSPSESIFVLRKFHSSRGPRQTILTLSSHS